MDLELLRTFLDLCRTRHFRRTADNLHLSQSTVSARIRQLEDALGTALFSRERNNIQPTAAGQRLLPHAEQMLLQWTRTRQELAVGAEREMLLVVGAAASLWETLLQSWLVRVHRREPEIALRIQTHDDEPLLRRMGEGLVDLGFTYDAPVLPRHESVPFGRVALRLVATRQGVSTAQATGEGYVRVDWGGSFNTRHAQLHPDAPPPRFECSHGRTALDLILACGGSAYLPEPMIAPLLEAGRLHPVEGVRPIGREVYATYRTDHRQAETLARLARRAKTKARS